MIGQDVTATYIYPGDLGVHHYEGPFDVPQYEEGHERKADEWVLLDATPASCANIGIHHLFKHKKPVDLVISGPNFGRNSTALYIMSSGTVGAAMEAALCGVKSIGISYAYETRAHNHAIIDQASKLGVQLIEHLYNNWDKGVQLYSVNVPLVDSLSDDTRILYAHILQNQWGPVFEPWEDYEKRIEEGVEDSEVHIGVPVKRSPNEEDASTPVDEDGENPNNSSTSLDQTNGTAKRNKALRQFRWKPDYQAVRDSVRESPEGNDGWVVDQGYISVTPLRACFHVVDISGDIKLKK